MRSIFEGVHLTRMSTLTSCPEIRPSARDAQAWGGKKRAVLQLHTRQIFSHTYLRKHIATQRPPTRPRLLQNGHILCFVASPLKLNRLALIRFGQGPQVESPQWQTCEFVWHLLKMNTTSASGVEGRVEGNRAQFS